MVGLGAAVDTHRRVILAVTIPVFVIIVAGLTASMVFGSYRRAQVRGNDLLGGRGAAAIVLFIWLIVGGTIGIALWLREAGVHEPGTIAAAIGTAGLAAGGPVLMRSLRRTMLNNRAGTGQ